MPSEATGERPKGLSLFLWRRPLSRAGEVALYAALHAAVAFVFFGRALLRRAVVVPADFLSTLYPWGPSFARHAAWNADLSDVILQFYPWFLRWGEAVRAGHLPLWNPWSELGLPFAANPVTASFFPLTALSLLGGAGWDLLLAARLFLAGLCATLLLRELGRSRAASCAGGIAFALSFPFFGWIQWPHANVNALLPLLLLLARRLALRPTPRAAAAFGATLALMHLGGHPESAFLDAAAALVVLLASRPRARGLLLLAAGGVLGTLAASIQIVPFLEYLGRSRVWLEPGHQALVLPRRFAVTWLMPLFYGRAAGATAWGPHIPFVDFCASAGAAVFALACVGTVLSLRRRRLLAPALLVVLPAGLAYGIPPLSWLLRLPLLGRVMTHRSLHVATLGVVVLAAIGWDRLRAARRAQPRRAALTGLVPVALAAAVLAAVLAARHGAPPALFGRTAVNGAVQAVLAAGAAWSAAMLVPLRRRLAAGAVLCAIVLADETVTALPFHSAARAPGGVFFATPLTRALAREARGTRILPLRRVMTPNLNLPYRLPSVLAYDAIDSLAQARFLRHLRAYAGVGLYSTVYPEDLRNPPAARLAGIGLLVDSPRAPRLDTGPFARETGYLLTCLHDGPDGRVYRLGGAWPLVRFLPHAESDPGFRRFDALLDAADEAAARTLFVDAPEATGDGGEGSVSYERPFPERLAVRVNAPSPGWIVVGEELDAGWDAQVDGVPAPIRAANRVLRAVRVPAGTHEVLIRYRPASIHLGLVLSLAGIAALALLSRRR